MKSLQISLRALAHPASLASIGLLILNDHFLKPAYPSAFTGKLSDFAGLFFFPFLLAALLAFPASYLRLAPRQVARLAFGVTFVWFGAIKTFPFANDWTENVLGFLLGYPTLIVLDPTDMIALVMLWPAWKLWVRTESGTMRRQQKMIMALAFGVAIWGAMASQPCPETPTVWRVASSNGNFYIHYGRGYDSIPNDTDQFAELYESTDFGKTWKPAGILPETVSDDFLTKNTLPVIVCSSDNPLQCYRITGNYSVEFSDDGAENWEEGWKAATYRLSYVKRTFYCGKKPELQPRDIAVLPRETGDVLLVSMGNEGLLRYTPEDGWNRLAFLEATPSSYRGNVIDIPFILLLENLSAMWLTLLLYPLLSLRAWHLAISRAPVESEGESIRKAKRKIRVGGLSFILPGFFLIMFISLKVVSNAHGDFNASSFGEALLSTSMSMVFDFLYFDQLLNPTFLFQRIPQFCILLFAFLLIRTWGKLQKLDPGSVLSLIVKETRQYIRFQPLWITLRIWLPFPLWLLGIIPSYWLAVLISAGLAIYLLWQTNRKLSELAN